MRHGFPARQVILGDDHARRLALGPRVRLERVRPLARGTEVDRAEILTECGLCRVRCPDTAAELRLRAYGLAALRPGRHALHDLRHPGRVVGGLGDALERMTRNA